MSMNFYELKVAGLPVLVGIDDGFYAYALFQSVRLDGSPFVFHFNPPVATVEEISVPGLLQALANAVLAGATIG